MVQIDAVGWSENYLDKTCSKCGKIKSLQYIQTQKRYKIGNFKLINSGPRDFGRECTNCYDLSAISKTDQSIVPKLKYYFKRPTPENISKKSQVSRNIKYPVLSMKQREEIRSENMKEAKISVLLGSIIGVIGWLFYPLAIWIVPITALLGIYAALEDPELKFKGLHEKNIGLKRKGKDSKRSLQ